MFQRNDSIDQSQAIHNQSLCWNTTPIIVMKNDWMRWELKVLQCTKTKDWEDRMNGSE